MLPSLSTGCAAGDIERFERTRIHFFFFARLQLSSIDPWERKKKSSLSSSHILWIGESLRLFSSSRRHNSLRWLYLRERSLHFCCGRWNLLEIFFFTRPYCLGFVCLMHLFNFFYVVVRFEMRRGEICTYRIKRELNLCSYSSHFQAIGICALNSLIWTWCGQKKSIASTRLKRENDQT